MNQTPPDYSAFINFLSVVVAACALIFAVFSDKRARKQFDESVKLQEKIATANVRPLLSVRGLNHQDVKKIVVRNDGLGTAIITRLMFQRDGREENSIVPLLDMHVVWNFDITYASVKTIRALLGAGKELEILVLTRFYLEKQGLQPQDIEEAFTNLQSQIIGISMILEYEDVLGNKRPTNPVDLRLVWSIDAS